MAGLLEEASRAGRVVSVALLTDLPAGEAQFLSADVWQTRLGGLTPKPWAPDAEAVAEWVDGLGGDGFETVREIRLCPDCHNKRSQAQRREPEQTMVQSMVQAMVKA